MTSLAFSNQKGGVGKSTLAVLFAQWLAEKQGASVCVVDLDSQRNCSKSLTQFSSGLTATALFSREALSVPVAAPSSITLIAGTKQLADIELAKPEAVIPAFCRNVAALSARHDFVIIDSPPSLGLRMSAALIAADAAICPIELEEFSIDGVTDMLQTVFGIRMRHNPRLQLLGILANRFNPHSLRQRAALHDLALKYGQYVLPAKISTRSAIPEALAAGVPVWRLAKSSARDATQEVLPVFDLMWQRMGALTNRAAEEASA